MTLLEIACAAIVLAYIANAVRLGQGREVAAWFPLVALAAWIGEDTSIRLYAYYGYAPAWHAFADHVPLAITLIWPVVILSARDVARQLAPERPAAWPWIATAIVGLDASLIEPVAVKAGLWAWASPGMFGVPPIGLAGWVLFALGTHLCMHHLAGWRRLAVLAVAPALGHAGLVAIWWGGYRLVDGFRWPEAAIATLGVTLLAGLGAWVLSRRAIATLPLGVVWPRMLAALFFFALLFTQGAWNPALVAYALAFAMPYCAALGEGSKRVPL